MEETVRELFDHDSKEVAMHGGNELSSARQLRGAFSDTEDFIDHGLVSAQRCSSRTSSISSWTENLKPSFTKKLKFQSVLEGESVELKCKLIACPPPTILWFHNNRSVPKERRRRISTDSRMHMHTTSLVIDGIRERDSGSYKVMAINTEGSAESTASLLVSLREEQSANYLGFARRSAKVHESVDSLAEQRKERKFRVDLRCVGSPFDKMSKVHQGRSRSKSALVRTMYFKSGSYAKEKETEKESKRLETASERAPSPPPMFDRSERFNDRFSDIYCDRRTGARFSDKFSDRCSDRYSERFSDTESLHNEVRTKLTTLQKAVRQKKRLSISTMSSSEFELESVASESSYAEYVERLRVKPASLPDVQHFNRPFDSGETHGELDGKRSGKESSRPRMRHSFEPQSRTRAIQIMRGELVDTMVPQEGGKVGEQESAERLVEADVRFKQRVAEAMKAEVELSPAEGLENWEPDRTDPALQEMSCTESALPKPVASIREKFLRDVAEVAAELDEKEEGEGSLRAQYEKSLEADRKECEDKLLALRIRKWQQGSRMSEEEAIQPEPDPVEDTGPMGQFYAQQEVVESRTMVEVKATPSLVQKHPEAAASKSPKIKTREEVKSASIITKSATEEVRSDGSEPKVLLVPTPRSPRTAARAPDGDGKSESPRLKSVRSAKEKFLSEAEVMEPSDGRAEPSLRAQYEKSLEAERMECEEKLLALRIRKWQQGVRLSEEETFHPETDLPMPADTPEEIIPTQQGVEEEPAALVQPAIPTPMSTKVQRGLEQEKTCAPLPKDRMKARTVEPEPRGMPAQKPARTKAKAAELESSPKTKPREEKMLFEKTSEERELQLSMENLSELKSETEKLVSEEEALTQRIMKWQQDVLMEQEPAVELESDWLQADTTPQVGEPLPSSDVVHSRKPSPGQPAEEKPLLSGSGPAGFQDQEEDRMQWPPAEGRETRLQRDSEYFVSEEEALAQRILKWQQDVVEQEEVAELESEWTELSHRSSPPQIAASGGASPAKRPSPAPPPPQVAEPSAPAGSPSDHPASPPCGELDGEAERRPSREKHVMTVDKSSNQRFQTDVREKRGMKEEIGTTRKSNEQREQKVSESLKKDDRAEDSIRSREAGVTRSSEPGAAKKWKVREESMKTVESERVNEEGARAASSHPVFVKKTSSLVVKTGEMSEFTCQFQGDPPPTVSWLKDGHPLDNNPDYDIMIKENKSKLTVFYPTTDHEGTYDLVITNKHGKSTCSATLQISDKKLQRKTVVAQEVVITEGVQKGEEHHESLIEEELQTYMDLGKATLQVPQAVIHRHQSLDESNTPSPVEIRITAATPVPEMCEESGEDRPQVADVQSDDGASQTIKHKFTFSFDVVGEAPLVVTQLENISCSEGSVAVLQCVISGEPSPEVTWYHDDICLDVTADKHRAEVDVKVYRLFISGFTSSDAGVYKCVARNKLGEVSSISEVSFQAGEPVQFSEGGEAKERDGLTRSGRLRKSSVGLTEDVKEPSTVQKAAEDKPQIRQTPSDVKPPRSRPGLSTVTPTISGCGLQGSAAVIKVSQIKQAFESDSPVALPPPSPEEQRKDTKFPEEFIPVVDTSPDQQVWMGAPGPDSMHRDQDDGLPMLPVAPEPIPSETSQPVEAVEGAAERHYVVKEFVEEVPEFSELLRPQPQKAAALPEQMEAGKVEMVKEEAIRIFDRTSSFIPFKPEKGPAVKHSVKSSGPTKEKPERDRTAEDVQEDISAGLDGSGFVEGLTETGTLLDQEVKGLEEVEQVSEEAELDGKELISIPEQSMDSGIFVSMPDSKVDVMKVSSEMVPGDVTETKIKTEGDRISILAESEPLVVKPKVGISIKPPDLPAEAAISVDGTLAAEAGGVAGASLEEEEVTFGAVYDYYNPPTDWGRPLSPESEMSIEIGSTMSEEITEVAERFYTPGSSTEVSLPIAESLHTLKSPTSFCTPSSEISPGFTTPDEYPFSPVKHQRPSTADSSEMFFSPVHFLPSPAERGFETSGVNMDENRFTSQNIGSLGLGTLQEKVQGIPPAFLKPLIKKRVFENDSLTFYAEVFGLPSPEVRWFCNKTQLVADDRVTMERDGDSISLTIHNITKADQGEYICEAVNYVGEARSVALVGVVSQEVRFMPAPPAVTHQHVMEFDVEENDSSRSPSPQEILLEVELDENEVKEFEKQVKIITIPEYTADNKSMVISLDVLPSIYEEGAVDFVTQEHDDLKIAFEVTEMPPRFINPICDMETPEGTTVMFECSLMGIPSPIVSWFKGDKKIPHSNKKYLHSSDGDNHFLKIYKVTTQDSGVYTCRAINLVGETLCRASLVVLNAKAFSGKTRGRELTAVSLGGAKVQPQKFDLMVGNTSFDGEQVSEIELEFEFEQEADESQRAVRLVANTNSETSEQGEKYVSVNFDVFAEPAKDDKVEFKGKSTDMCSFQFQVTETPPKCIIPLTNVTAAVGTPVILQCLVCGKPNPIAQWFKDGEPVTDSRCIIQEKTAGHFNLLITNVTQSDAGEYKCMIQNSAGFTETTALLKVF